MNENQTWSSVPGADIALPIGRNVDAKYIFMYKHKHDQK